MHVNCADFVYKAMGEYIQVLYLLSFDNFFVGYCDQALY